MDILTGKVAIITGSSSGIGAETAVYFAARGAKVVITGRNQAGLDDTEKRCRDAGATSDKLLLITGDVTNKCDIDKIVDAAVNGFGKIDILVNNAGVLLRGRFEDTSDEDVLNMFKSNTVSMFNVTKKVLPWLLKTKGTIVNVSSISGTRPSDDVIAYSMSKAAVNQFTKCLAIEYASKGVRINAVNPGFIETAIFRRSGYIEDSAAAILELKETVKKRYPMQRVGEPSEVAAAILFLASDQSTFTTGALLPVCGGRECSMMGAISE